MWRHNKTCSCKYKLGKNIEAWVSNSSLSFSSSSPLLSFVLFCLSIVFHICTLILHIENFCRLIDLTFKDCNYSLYRTLASTNKFYSFIYERYELFNLWDSLTFYDLLETVTELDDLITDQRVINNSNTFILWMKTFSCIYLVAVLDYNLWWMLTSILWDRFQIHLKLPYRKIL